MLSDAFERRERDDSDAGIEDGVLRAAVFFVAAFFFFVDAAAALLEDSADTDDDGGCFCFGGRARV